MKRSLILADYRKSGATVVLEKGQAPNGTPLYGVTISHRGYGYAKALSIFIAEVSPSDRERITQEIEQADKLRFSE